MIRSFQGNSTLFYATTFDVHPDDPRYEVWPCIIGAFQDWVISKERKRISKSTNKTQKKTVDIAMASEWSFGMRMSAHSALLMRSKMIGLIEKSIKDGSASNSRRKQKQAKHINELIRKDMVPWTSCAEGVEILKEISLSERFVNGISCTGGHLSRLETLSTGEGPIPEHWAMDYEEDDPENWWRTWRTQVGVTRSDLGIYTVTVQVFYSIDPTLLRTEISAPLRNIPICVRKLLDIEGMTCISGEDPLSVDALYVGGKEDRENYSFEQFYSDLTKPLRALPLVVVSSDESGVFPVNPDEISRKLRGAAIVAALDRANVQLNKCIEKTFFNRNSKNYPFRPPRNSVRIYFPRLNSNEPRDSRRHFIFTTDQIEALGNNAINRLASDVISSVARAFAYSEEAVSSCSDIREIVDKRRRDELAKKYRDAAISAKRNDESAEFESRYKKVMQELDYANQARKEQNAENIKTRHLLEESMQAIREKDGEIDDLSEYAELLEKDLDSARDQNALLKEKNNEIEDENLRLKYEAEALKGKLDKKEATSIDDLLLRTMASIPKTVFESLKLASEFFAERLIVLPQAFESAEKHSSGDADEAWRILRGLALEMYNILFFGENQQQGAIDDEFYAKTGFKVSFRDTKATKNHASYKKKRTVSYQGRDIDISPHVKGKSGNRNETLRVHFASDHTNRKIIIGHCGAHFETAGTKRKSL